MARGGDDLRTVWDAVPRPGGGFLATPRQRLTFLDAALRVEQMVDPGGSRLEHLDLAGDRVVVTAPHVASSPNTSHLLVRRLGDALDARTLLATDARGDTTRAFLGDGHFACGGRLAVAGVRNEPSRLFVADLTQDPPASRILEFEGAQAGCSRVTVTERLVVGGSWKGELLGWTLPTSGGWPRPAWRVPDAHGQFVGDVSASADGRRLVSAGADGLVRVWELEGP